MEFRIIEVPLSEIRELKEVHWFGLGAPPVAEEIAQHAKQIYEADLSCPNILCPEGGVMDGMHRVCKAHLQEHEFISAVKLS